MANRKQPEIRFSGYTDDWEQHKLGEELELLKDGTHGTHVDVADGPYLLSAKNIKNGQISISSDDRKISTDEFDRIHKNFKLQENDVLLTVVGSIGESALMTNYTNITFQRSVAYLRSTSISSQFLYSLTTSPNFQKELKNRQVVSAQPGIYLGDLAKIPIAFPKSNDEQQKIGQFFKQLDDTIILHQSKLELLKEQKKGFLQKMFPKAGANTPEIRFAGFTDDWKECKLKDIAEYRNGKAHEQVEDIAGRFTIINSKFISTDSEIQRHTNKQVAPMFKGELAIVLSDLPNGKALGKVFLVEENNKYTLNQRIAGITPKENMDSKFLNYRMNRNTYFLRFDSGVSQTNLSKPQVEEFTALYPNFEEQIKIGLFFKKIDDTIALHQQELDLLKETKKGFLQKMFV